jgi:DNA-binding NarL/FixJ family response regulator
MIKVAVFEDNKNRRDGLKMLIEESDNMICSGAYEDCSGVVQHLTSAPADVVLMDIDMPNVNGIEGVIEIRKHFPEVFILMQTVFEDEDKIFASICAGANGYLLKKTPAEKIINSIYEVTQGDVPMTPSIAKKILETFKKQSGGGSQQFFNLSPREKEILTLLVKGMSYKMIAAKCEISFNTVNTHMQKIYEKLHVHSATEAVTKAIEHKIV